MHNDESRRRFIAAMAACAAGVGLGTFGGARAGTSARPVLGLPPEQLATDYDVVVVGSGYGGAVMGARLARGRRLAILERGREWQPADFPADAGSALAQLQCASNPLGLFDVRIGADLDVLSGNGLGGTSLINANVVIAPDRDIFTRWPRAIQDAYASGAMDTYEARVCQMLAVDAVFDANALRKNWFHASTAAIRQRQGAPVRSYAAKLAVNLRRYADTLNEQGVQQSLCTGCGDCVSGCRVGAKNTLDVNYLPLARAQGASIFTRVEVEWLERLPDATWRIHYLIHDSGATRRGQLRTRHVILAAGALGSTQVLLRSRAQGLALPSALGTRFSSNGDLLGIGYNGQVRTDVVGFGAGALPDNLRRAGPTITTVADYRQQSTVSQRFLIEEAAAPSVLASALQLTMPALAGSPADVPAAQRAARDLGLNGADGALNHSMIYLGIGHDSASGRVELDSNGRAHVVWPGILDESFVSRLRSEMAAHAAPFGAVFVNSPRSGVFFGGGMTTVHPLGGCPMGESGADGVVNADGQVFDPGTGGAGVYAGLRVMDGSVVPASIGANPLLTIAALAERAAERFTG